MVIELRQKGKHPTFNSELMNCSSVEEENLYGTNNKHSNTHVLISSNTVFTRVNNSKYVQRGHACMLFVHMLHIPLHCITLYLICLIMSVHRELIVFSQARRKMILYVFFSLAQMTGFFFDLSNILGSVSELFYSVITSKVKRRHCFIRTSF